MHKYLQTIKRGESIPVEFQIAIIAESFLHYFGDSYDDSYAKIENAENAMRYQYSLLSQHAGVCLDNDDSITQVVKFYNRGKHFHGESKEKDFVIEATDKERVHLAFFVQSLFRFSVLYDLLEDNNEMFKDIYRQLVTHHIVLNKFYVM